MDSPLYETFEKKQIFIFYLNILENSVKYKFTFQYDDELVRESLCVKKA